MPLQKETQPKTAPAGPCAHGVECRQLCWHARGGRAHAAAGPGQQPRSTSTSHPAATAGAQPPPRTPPRAHVAPRRQGQLASRPGLLVAVPGGSRAAAAQKKWCCTWGSSASGGGWGQGPTRRRRRRSEEHLLLAQVFADEAVVVLHERLATQRVRGQLHLRRRGAAVMGGWRSGDGLMHPPIHWAGRPTLAGPQRGCARARRGGGWQQGRPAAHPSDNHAFCKAQES